MKLIFKQGDIELWSIVDWVEFCIKAQDGHLDLDIHSEVYPTIAEKIFPRDVGFFLGSYKKYRRRLIMKMIDDKNIFTKVLNTGGVDFYYNTKIQHFDFRPLWRRILGKVFN